MKPIFADTSYFIALLSETDERHDAAVEWSETLLGRQVVTEYILVELGSALSKIRNRHLYVPFVEQVLAEEGTDFIPASGELFRRGPRWYAGAACGGNCGYFPQPMAKTELEDVVLMQLKSHEWLRDPRGVLNEPRGVLNEPRGVLNEPRGVPDEPR